MHLVEKDKLMEMTFRSADGNTFTADKYVVFQYLNQNHGTFIGVVILCVVVAFMLWLFVGYHLWLIKKGFTTNEQSKEGQAGFFLERCVGFFEKWEGLKKDSNKSDFKPSARTLEFYEVKDNDLSLEEIQKKHKEYVKALD